MQFGGLYGTGLMILGIILCVFQFIQYTSSNKERLAQTETRPVRPEPVRSSLPGIVGAASLVGGFALFVTARRR